MAQTTQPPAGQSLLIEGTDQTAMSWVHFFQSVSDRLDACEARLLVGEARLLSSEARHLAHETRLASIEARLSAAGIP